MPLRAAVVSRYLKGQGFERSESWTTAIKGWHDYSSGFRAMQLDEDSVRVDYVSGHYIRTNESVRHESAFLQRIVEACEGKYRAEFHEDGVFGPYVVVRK
jgi:hypothetical protein